MEKRSHRRSRSRSHSRSRSRSRSRGRRTRNRRSRSRSRNRSRNCRNVVHLARMASWWSHQSKHAQMLAKSQKFMLKLLLNWNNVEQGIKEIGLWKAAMNSLPHRKTPVLYDLFYFVEKLLRADYVPLKQLKGNMSVLQHCLSKEYQGDAAVIDWLVYCAIDTYCQRILKDTVTLFTQVSHLDVFLNMDVFADLDLIYFWAKNAAERPKEYDLMIKSIIFWWTKTPTITEEILFIAEWCNDSIGWISDRMLKCLLELRNDQKETIAEFANIALVKSLWEHAHWYKMWSNIMTHYTNIIKANECLLILWILNQAPPQSNAAKHIMNDQNVFLQVLHSKHIQPSTTDKFKAEFNLFKTWADFDIYVNCKDSARALQKHKDCLLKDAITVSWQQDAYMMASAWSKNPAKVLPEDLDRICKLSLKSCDGKGPENKYTTFICQSARCIHDPHLSPTDDITKNWLEYTRVVTSQDGDMMTLFVAETHDEEPLWYFDGAKEEWNTTTNITPPYEMLDIVLSCTDKLKQISASKNEPLRLVSFPLLSKLQTLHSETDKGRMFVNIGAWQKGTVYTHCVASISSTKHRRGFTVRLYHNTNNESKTNADEDNNSGSLLILFNDDITSFWHSGIGQHNLFGRQQCLIKIHQNQNLRILYDYDKRNGMGRLWVPEYDCQGMITNNKTSKHGVVWQDKTKVYNDPLDVFHWSVTKGSFGNVWGKVDCDFTLDKLSMNDDTVSVYRCRDCDIKLHKNFGKFAYNVLELTGLILDPGVLDCPMAECHIYQHCLVWQKMEQVKDNHIKMYREFRERYKTLGHKMMIFWVICRGPTVMEKWSKNTKDSVNLYDLSDSLALLLIASELTLVVVGKLNANWKTKAASLNLKLCF